MKKVDLVIFPFHDYKKWINEGFRTRDAHLFEYFIENENIGKVLVINRPVSLAEIVLKRQGWKMKNVDAEDSSFNHQLSKMNDKVYVLDSFIPDFFRVAIEKKAWWNICFNNTKVMDNIKKSIKHIGMDNVSLLIQTPMATGAIGKLDEKYVVFDAIDNWLHHPQMQKYKNLIQKKYDFIDKNADIIFTVSEDLKAIFKTNNNVNWISNGVDIDYFKSALKKKNKSKNTVIGYVGKIQDRIDFNLVEECLKKYTNYKFVFCGPILSCKDRINELSKKYKNIEFTGDIHYNLLPNKMREFDITIIPHKVDSFTNSMNPLKLYEYIASGKQVISTCIAGTENISPYVYLSQNYDEFISNIEKSINALALNENLAYDVSESLDKSYTWKNKTNEIVKKICSLNQISE